MSKTKKIATAVVSVVLAGAMCFSFAACGDKTNRIDYPTFTPDKPANASQNMLPLSVVSEEDHTLAYNDGTQLSMNMGQNSTYTISFRNNKIAQGSEVTLPDGVKYGTGDMKPAWKTLSEELDVSLVDSFTALSSSQQITQAVTDRLLGSYTMISGDSTAIVNEGAANNSFLDLSLYLDYMPNFKYFLEQNPVVRMSLTSNTNNGAIYYAPYFDGNDDIEKYELANQHWVIALLDTDAEDLTSNGITFAAQAAGKTNPDEGKTPSSGDDEEDISYDNTQRAPNSSLNGAKTSVEAFMGSEDWWVETTNSADGSTTANVYVSYSNALAQAKDTSTALGKAISDAKGSAYTGTSGNIVDIQNDVINSTKGAVTGKQLVAILQAYIDAAYRTAATGGESFYKTRSDVFNGYNAAWDVDLLVALSRCIVTNTANLGDNINIKDNQVYAIGARQGNVQRQNDLTSLAGELYGVRGLTSRYQYTYIDKDGVLHDARTGADMWEALDNLNDMVKEGLLYTGTNNQSGKTSYYTDSKSPVIFMIYDYVQTQTANGGYALMGETTINGLPEDYNFAPIVTPVSKWNDGDTATTDNVDGISYDYDGNSKYMRFTESWRSVKNTGFAIPYANVLGNPERLSAALSVIDYMFSNDGQFVMTYGQQSTNGNTAKENTDGSYTATDNGWWYGTKVTNVTLSDVAVQVPGSDQYTVKDEYASQYFIYKNEVYTGVLYKGQQQPIMTTANQMLYLGHKVNGVQLSGKGTVTESWGYARSYTNYARGVIGSAQPMGNKLQSFEYQCTPDIGIEGADKVALSLVNGTISHVFLQLDNAKNSLWYTIVPTTLPYDSNTASAINTTFNVLTNNVFSGDSGDSTNLPNDVIWFGLGYSEARSYAGNAFTIPATGAGMADALSAVSAFGASAGGIKGFETLMQAAWQQILEYFGD